MPRAKSLKHRKLERNTRYVRLLRAKQAPFTTNNQKPWTGIYHRDTPPAQNPGRSREGWVSDEEKLRWFAPYNGYVVQKKTTEIDRSDESGQPHDPWSRTWPQYATQPAPVKKPRKRRSDAGVPRGPRGPRPKTVR